MGFYDELKQIQKENPTPPKKEEEKIKLLSEDGIRQRGDELLEEYFFGPLRIRVKNRAFITKDRGFLRGKKYYYFAEMPFANITLGGKDVKTCFLIKYLSDYGDYMVGDYGENVEKIFNYINFF